MPPLALMPALKAEAKPDDRDTPVSNDSFSGANGGNGEVKSCQDASLTAANLAAHTSTNGAVFKASDAAEARADSPSRAVALPASSAPPVLVPAAEPGTQSSTPAVSMPLPVVATASQPKAEVVAEASSVISADEHATTPHVAAPASVPVPVALAPKQAVSSADTASSQPVSATSSSAAFAPKPNSDAKADAVEEPGLATSARAPSLSSATPRAPVPAAAVAESVDRHADSRSQSTPLHPADGLKEGTAAPGQDRASHAPSWSNTATPAHAMSTQAGNAGSSALVPVDPQLNVPWTTVPSSSIGMAPPNNATGVCGYSGVTAAAGPLPPLQPVEEVVNVAMTFKGRRKLVRHGSATRVGQILELHPSLLRTGKEYTLVDSQGFEIGKELPLGTLSRGGALVELEVQEEMWGDQP